MKDFSENSKAKVKEVRDYAAPLQDSAPAPHHLEPFGQWSRPSQQPGTSSWPSRIGHLGPSPGLTGLCQAKSSTVRELHRRSWGWRGPGRATAPIPEHGQMEVKWSMMGKTEGTNYRFDMFKRSLLNCIAYLDMSTVDISVSLYTVQRTHI